MTDKDFINYLRRAINAGASLEGIKTEIDIEVAARVYAASKRKAAPLSVCSALLREAGKISRSLNSTIRFIVMTESRLPSQTAHILSSPRRLSQRRKR
jgi:hypothetical protein